MLSLFVGSLVPGQDSNGWLLGFQRHAQSFTWRHGKQLEILKWFNTGVIDSMELPATPWQKCKGPQEGKLASMQAPRKETLPSA